jgi:hypothetical protein
MGTYTAPILPPLVESFKGRRYIFLSYGKNAQVFLNSYTVAALDDFYSSLPLEELEACKLRLADRSNINSLVYEAYRKRGWL